MLSFPPMDDEEEEGLLVSTPESSPKVQGRFVPVEPQRPGRAGVKPFSISRKTR